MGWRGRKNKKTLFACAGKLKGRERREGKEGGRRREIQTKTITKNWNNLQTVKTPVAVTAKGAKDAKRK